MAEGENVKVAVRVRPFNSREKARNATLIIDMKGPTTYIKDPENLSEEPRKFNFDFSYWSHDGFRDQEDGYMLPDKSHPNGGKYADQGFVYENLGAGILTNAWNGYNATLFAYGQTGSGKSYSMVGYGINKGIVPLFCDKLFTGIEEKKSQGVEAQYEVTFSMLEIYNEQVRDLLTTKGAKKGGLKVRQHPKRGFYAEGLTQAAVDSYRAIDSKMNEGTTNRTVAATNMNATSSRAHTIVGIQFVQKQKNAAGQEMAKTSIVNLVDLAGSERADSTGATGDRLKEGAAINQSLSTLGNVISALADNAGGKKTRVPYRDSVLTKLLKNALGGNSKTIMIAAVSPADINYEESLSTLRYADRAKQIKTVALVNEDPTEKLIRELQEENERLKKLVAGGGKIDLQADEDTTGMSEAEKEALRAEMEEDFKARMAESQEEIEQMKRSWQEKLAAAQASTEDDQAAVQERRKKEAHIANLNVDPMLSGNIVHFLDKNKNIGKEAEIVIRGPNIMKEQANFTIEGKKFFIEKCGDAKVMRNGLPVTDKTELHHTDRLVFGTTAMYVFYHPAEAAASGQQYADVTHEMAQEEIAANSGFDMNTENKSRDEMLLQEDLIDILPAIFEANAISEELDRKKKFEVMLVSGAARGEPRGRTQVYVKMVDLETDHEYSWTKERFLNRKYVMQEMFENYTDGEAWQLPADRDPFVEDPNAEVHIGTVQVYMQSLAFMIEMKEQLDIVDYKGQAVGHVNLELVPCDKKGREYTEDDETWVDNPRDLVGKDLHCVLKIHSARGVPSRFTCVRAAFKMYLENEGSTKPIDGTSNPDWNFSHLFHFTPVTSQLVDYLADSMMVIQIWGKQKPPKNKKTVNTKDLLNKQALAKGQAAGDTNTKKVDAEKVRYIMELAVYKKRTEKAEQKVAHVRELVRLAELYQKQRVSTQLIKELLAAPNADVAQRCLRLVEKEKGAEEPASAPRPAASSKPRPKQGSETRGEEKGKSKLCVLL